MIILSLENLASLVKRHGLKNFLEDLIQKLKQDFKNWESFSKIPRPAMHVPGGVLELMPICGKDYYTFKYVNCHPKNPEQGLMTVVATGQLSRVDTGYPLLFTEMTLLTALRTAATTAIATDLMAKKGSKVLSIIGTGAQSEFLVTAIALVRDIQEVKYFDVDAKAMDKFESNLTDVKFKLTRCLNIKDAVSSTDIITTCTACKAHVDVLKNSWIQNGVHINALGGDTVGKTELEKSILDRSKIVVEYFDQSFIEGEIQRYNKEEAKQKVFAELHELIGNKKLGRINDQEVTVYDSVGIALEDYSALTLTYELAKKYNLGQNINITPNIKDPKNLVGLVR